MFALTITGAYRSVLSCPHQHQGVFMATTAMAYGERRFGAAYPARIIVVLVVLGIWAGVWASQDDPRIASHPTLLWISLALGCAAVGLWIVMGKSALTISDSGLRRGAGFGPPGL